MPYIKVFGQYKHFYNDVPASAGQIVKVRLMTVDGDLNDFDAEAIYLAEEHSVVLMDNGYLPDTDNGDPADFLLWCNAGGSTGSIYEFTDPDGKKWRATIQFGDGTPKNITEIRAGGVVPADTDTVLGLIETNIANSAVRFDIAQSLSDAEKLQARTNIGAGTGDGGGVSGSGTVGTVPVFTDTDELGDSSIAEDSTLVTVNKNQKILAPTSASPGLHIEHPGSSGSDRYIYAKRAGGNDAFYIDGNLMYYGSPLAGGGITIRSNASGRGVQISGATNTLWLVGAMRFTYSTIALSADQDGLAINASNYGRFINLTADSNYYIGGLVWSVSGVPRESGNVVSLINASEHNITFKHDHSGQATTSYRFLTVDGSDLVLAPNERAEVVYDGFTQKFRIWKIG